MQTYLIKDLVSKTTNELKLILGDQFKILFEDGIEIETSRNKTIYSSYFWDIHRQYPKTPVYSTHHVNHVLKGKPLTSSTHIQLLEIIFDDVCNVYNLHIPESKEHLLGLVYQVTNNIHNEVSKEAESHVMSIDILDFIGVIEHPVISEVINQEITDRDMISGIYSKVLDTINNDISLKDNQLVKAIKSKMVNANQALQCIALRGFVTEVDGSILPEPVLTNYTKGLSTLYDYVAESRTAAKSLYFAEAPLQDAEYFARRLQLLTMTVESITYNDCGSNDYINWKISPPEYDDKGSMIYKGDLNFMIGKYYLDESNNSLKMITHDDTTLHNKVLRLRSVIHCKNKNPHTVCEVCFGALSKNISKYANLGHICSAIMTQQTSQSVLSTKHLDASSVSSDIILSEDASKYMYVNNRTNSYFIKKELKGADLKLVVNKEEANGLTDILIIEDVDNLNPSRVSNVEYIELIYTTKEGLELTIPLSVKQGNQKAVLSTEFLKYLKIYNWGTDSKNNFIFNLDNWDFNSPILRLPDMEYSFSDHSRQIAELIESNMKSLKKRLTPNSPTAVLQELFKLVNIKLNVNLAPLEVIIYACTVTSEDNPSLARNTEHQMLGVAAVITKQRSLGPAYTYEDQHSVIMDPRSFFKTNRPDSVFDVFMQPHEVVEAYKGM